MQLRPYQQYGIDDALEFLRTSPVGARRMYVAPTGTGKGVIQRSLREKIVGAGYRCILLAPNREIARNWGSPDWVMTPVAFRNRLERGEIEPPEVILVDEAHHDVGSNISYGDIFLMCATSTRFIGFTATPFRGTSKGTQALRELWGDPVWLLRLPEACKNGWLQLPKVQIEPLVDDDKLVVQNGEFVIKSANAATTDRFEALADLVRQFLGTRQIVALPSTQGTLAFGRYLEDAGIEHRIVLQDTSAQERTEAYEACKNGVPLLQIRILSEGVDFPWLETLIDARPTMSPVLWLQTFGRLTRPWECEKTYVCTNRNLERHAYLLEGAVPPQVISEAQKAFGGPSIRNAVRAIGLEGVGRFKPLPVKFASGVEGTLYNLYSVEDTKKVEYAILLHPSKPEPFVFTRENLVKPDGTYRWGRWRRVEGLPSDFVGYSTSPYRNEMSEKQAAWWARSAARFGLDAKHKPSAREFVVLPILADTRTRVE